MKNVLLFLLFLVLIASVVEAKIVNDSIYQIPRTYVAPVIDGIQDNIWKTIDWNMQRYYTIDGTPSDSGAGLCGMSKAMWDANNIYILFYTVDDVVMDIPANAGYNQDGVEIYLDGTNDHTPETSIKSGIQHHFTFPHWLLGQEVGHIAYAVGTDIDTANIEYKLRDVTDTEGFPGWILEVKIPLAALGIDGSTPNQLIGFELQQNEGDDGVGRQSMSKWWSALNDSWQNAGIWGTAILSDRTIDTALEIQHAYTIPTIDGVMDAVYKIANPITTNLFRVGDPPTAENPVVNSDPMFGGFITAYLMWDASNLYIFCDVVDHVITDIPANAAWNQDAVELYIDGTNDHTPETTLKDGQYHFTFPHWMKDQEAGKLTSIFGATFDTSGVEFKIKDHDARGNSGVLVEEGSGYNLEVKIPLAALSIDGSWGPSLGFELQLDNSSDVAAGRGGMQKWWNSSNNSSANAGLWGYTRQPWEPVRPTPSSVVSSFKLEQNYPNPFNPTTTITYNLVKVQNLDKVMVSLRVYDVLGREVAVLVNERKPAGTYTQKWNAEGLPSGVYFYQLKTGSYAETKKLILLK